MSGSRAAEALHGSDSGEEEESELTSSESASDEDARMMQSSLPSSRRHSGCNSRASPIPVRRPSGTTPTHGSVDASSGDAYGSSCSLEGHALQALEAHAVAAAGGERRGSSSLEQQHDTSDDDAVRDGDRGRASPRTPETCADTMTPNDGPSHVSQSRRVETDATVVDQHDSSDSNRSRSSSTGVGRTKGHSSSHTHSHSRDRSGSNSSSSSSNSSGGEGDDTDDSSDSALLPDGAPPPMVHRLQAKAGPFPGVRCRGASVLSLGRKGAHDQPVASPRTALLTVIRKKKFEWDHTALPVFPIEAEAGKGLMIKYPAGLRLSEKIPMAIALMDVRMVRLLLQQTTWRSDLMCESDPPMTAIDCWAAEAFVARDGLDWRVKTCSHALAHLERTVSAEECVVVGKLLLLAGSNITANTLQLLQRNATTLLPLLKSYPDADDLSSAHALPLDTRAPDDGEALPPSDPIQPFWRERGQSVRAGKKHVKGVASLQPSYMFTAKFHVNPQVELPQPQPPLPVQMGSTCRLSELLTLSVKLADAWGLLVYLGSGGDVNGPVEEHGCRSALELCCRKWHASKGTQLANFTLRCRHCSVHFARQASEDHFVALCSILLAAGAIVTDAAVEAAEQPCTDTGLPKTACQKLLRKYRKRNKS